MVFIGLERPTFGDNLVALEKKQVPSGHIDIIKYMNDRAVTRVYAISSHCRIGIKIG